MALNECSTEFHYPFLFYTSQKITVPQGVSKIVKIDPPIANFPKDGVSVTPGKKVWWHYEINQLQDLVFHYDDEGICYASISDTVFVDYLRNKKILVHFQ